MSENKRRIDKSDIGKPNNLQVIDGFDITKQADSKKNKIIAPPRKGKTVSIPLDFVHVTHFEVEKKWTIDEDIKQNFEKQGITVELKSNQHGTNTRCDILSTPITPPPPLPPKSCAGQLKDGLQLNPPPRPPKCNGGLNH